MASPLQFRIVAVMFFVLGSISITAVDSFADDDWTRFRGMMGAGRSAATGIVDSWGDAQSIAWRCELPGPGASSPVHFGNRIYVTCYTGYGTGKPEDTDSAKLVRHLLCLDAKDGVILWDAPLPSSHPVETYEGFIALHGYASGTPVVDETGIYVFYGSTGAAAFDFDGQLRWTQHLGAELHAFGTSNSPVLFEDMVIVNASIESGSLVALRKSDGAEVWRRDGIVRSWNTPVVYASLSGQPELALMMEGKLIALDPRTGEDRWHAAAINDYICPSVIVNDGILYALGGRSNMSMAVRSGGSGDVTETHVLWTQRRGSNVTSPIFHEGHLYWTSESKGIAYCVDATTGEVVYEQRLEPKPDRIYASGLLADGKLFYVSREAGTYVVDARPTFRLLAHNQIMSDTSVFNGSPIIVAGRLILRSDRFLYAIGE